MSNGWQPNSPADHALIATLDRVRVASQRSCAACISAERRPPARQVPRSSGRSQTRVVRPGAPGRRRPRGSNAAVYALERPASGSPPPAAPPGASAAAALDPAIVPRAPSPSPRSTWASASGAGRLRWKSSPSTPSRCPGGASPERRGHRLAQARRLRPFRRRRVRTPAFVEVDRATASAPTVALKLASTAGTGRPAASRSGSATSPASCAVPRTSATRSWSSCKASPPMRSVFRIWLTITLPTADRGGAVKVLPSNTMIAGDAGGRWPTAARERSIA